QVLVLGKDLVRAVHVKTQEVLHPVVGVGAATARAHLNQPWPDGTRWGINRHGPGGHDVSVGQQLVAWPALPGLPFCGSPVQAPCLPPWISRRFNPGRQREGTGGDQADSYRRSCPPVND